jgi:hypothetical protein
MGATQSHEGGDDTDVPRDLDRDIKEMNEIGEPASGSSAVAPARRSRRQTRHASAKSAAKSKGSYAAVRKTRRR